MNQTRRRKLPPSKISTKKDLANRITRARRWENQVTQVKLTSTEPSVIKRTSTSKAQARIPCKRVSHIVKHSMFSSILTQITPKIRCTLGNHQGMQRKERCAFQITVTNKEQAPSLVHLYRPCRRLLGSTQRLRRWQAMLRFNCKRTLAPAGRSSSGVDMSPEV